MASRKKPWFARMPKLTVGWTCAGTKDRAYYSNGDAVSRMVLLATDLDNREIITLLTPNEARAVAYRLAQQADRVDEANAEQSNGGAYPDEATWAAHRGVVIALSTTAAEEFIRDMNAVGMPSTDSRKVTDRLHSTIRSQLRRSA